MPSSPVLYHTGLGVFVAITLLALSASLLTLVASSISLWLYRRKVASLMSLQSGRPGPGIAGDTPQRSPAPAHRGSDSDSVKGDAMAETNEPPAPGLLYRRMISAPRRLAFNYAVAGLAFALLLGGCGFFAFSQTQINYLRAAAHPLQFFYLLWIFVWPIVLTINLVAASSRRSHWLLVLGYFCVLIALAALVSLTPTEAPFLAGSTLLPAWSGETPMRLVSKWGLFNFAPTLLLIAFRYRRVRAVAPLVLSFMMVVAAGALGMITAGFYYQKTSLAVISYVAETLDVSVMAVFIGYFLLLVTLACLLFGVFAWRLVSWIRSAYHCKTVSDQSLSVDALWLIFACFYAVMLAVAGPGWALWALVAFGVFKLVVNAGNKRLRAKYEDRHQEPALLILRVFALGKRSEILFDAVTRYWRHIGKVRLIAGTDLALATVAPHQFLAFVSGRLGQLFIRDEATMDRNLAELDSRRDQDGRFRINDLFCHADTWQAVLSRLVKRTDGVLMDLRSFSERNAGCVFEIKELLNTVPLRRLVFVIDETTNKALLKQTLEASCRELRSDSPNLGVAASALQPFELKSAGHSEIQRLMQRLCGSAGQERVLQSG